MDWLSVTRVGEAVIHSHEEAKSFEHCFKVFDKMEWTFRDSVVASQAYLTGMKDPAIGALVKALRSARTGFIAFLSNSKNCGCEIETNFVCGYHRDLNEIDDALATYRKVTGREG